MAFLNKNKVDYEKLYRNELQKNNDLRDLCLELKKTFKR